MFSTGKIQATLAAALLMSCIAPLAGQDEPALPLGLRDPRPAAEQWDEPALPQGLGGGRATSEPDLPPGLGGIGDAARDEPALPIGLDISEPAPSVSESLPTRERVLEAWTETLRERYGLDVRGFWEMRLGHRLQNDPNQKDWSIAESRIQVGVNKTWRNLVLRSTTDLVYDPVLGRHGVNLEEGRGALDLRELNVVYRPNRFMDLTVGRQILTWGTGDMLFINDLFPKDWNSFFIGRDDAYLKAPSDALKVSLFSRLANLDIVYTPRFDADRYIDGRRISYYNPMLERVSGRDAVVRADQPDRWFRDDEIALRLHRNIRSTELAAYLYRGFWKSPAGTDPATGRATFPALNVYGVSARRPIYKGIGNIELGYYDSSDDRSGRDPFVRNSEVRALIGYEQEIARNFTAGLQYYLEYMMEHDRYAAALPDGMPRADEDRHVVTLRLTRFLMNQNLELSLFTYFSPSDTDAYLRPRAHYKVNDFWSVEAGGNIFVGKSDHTFFGQFEKTNNAYIGLRRSF